MNAKRFFSAIIDIDAKRYFRCNFTNCTLRYAGDQCEWDKDTVFISCC